MKQRALSAAVADPLRNSPRDSPAGSLSGKASPIRHRPGLSRGLPRVRSHHPRPRSSSSWTQRVLLSLHLSLKLPARGKDLLGRSASLGSRGSEGSGGGSRLRQTVPSGRRGSGRRPSAQRWPGSQHLLLGLCAPVHPPFALLPASLSCFFCLAGPSSTCFHTFCLSLFCGSDSPALSC